MAQWYQIASLSANRTHAGASSMSGRGSSADGTIGIRAVLPHLIRSLRIETIADIPCGDFNWMREVLASPLLQDHHVRYFGGDIVGKLAVTLNSLYGGGRVAFTRFDLATQSLWPVDLVVLRDVLLHFSKARALRVLQMLSASGARYLLTTSTPSAKNSRTCEVEFNMSTKAHVAPLPNGCSRWFVAGLGFRGQNVAWPINLQDDPFNLPPPIIAFGIE